LDVINGLLNKLCKKKSLIPFDLFSGYNWQKQKLDPSIMNVKGENALPHLVQVIHAFFFLLFIVFLFRGFSGNHI